MTDDEKRREQIDALLAQDHDIEAAKLQEFRMKLETSLADFERRGARVRKTALIAGIVYVLNIILGMIILREVPADSWRSFLLLPWAIIGWLAMIVGGYALFLYLLRYMPAMRRLRYDIQNSMILDLQQQIAALREELKANRK